MVQGYTEDSCKNEYYNPHKAEEIQSKSTNSRRKQNEYIQAELLTWSQHMLKIIEKATTAIWACFRLFSKTWELPSGIIDIEISLGQQLLMTP